MVHGGCEFNDLEASKTGQKIVLKEHCDLTACTTVFRSKHCFNYYGNLPSLCNFSRTVSVYQHVPALITIQVVCLQNFCVLQFIHNVFTNIFLKEQHLTPLY